MIVSLGIVQEQHPERARLFLQWSRIDWPVLVDSLNLLGMRTVPTTVFIDENGIVQVTDARPADLGDFLVTSPEGGMSLFQTLPPARNAGDLVPEPPVSAQTPFAWRDYADALILWTGGSRLDEAIEAYHRQLDLVPMSSATMFRLGVAYRMRYDALSDPDDFAAAVDNWSHALGADLNQYIWRRRLQQYGPRRDKPYPYYDWVRQAQDEIRKRGGYPVPLVTPLTGAELAAPIRGQHEQDDELFEESEPDPRNEINVDPNPPHVQARFVAVPDTLLFSDLQVGQPKAHAYRIFVTLTPDSSVNTWWNNEAGGLDLWLEPPPGYAVDRQLHHVLGPENTETSREPRSIEFELRPLSGDDAPMDMAPTIQLTGYALYNVCEHEDGTCMFLRQNFELTLDK